MEAESNGKWDASARRDGETSSRHWSVTITSRESAMVDS